VNKPGTDDLMDVAGIISELRSVQKGVEEGILILEQSQRRSGTANAAPRSFVRHENQRTQTSATTAARGPKKLKCRKVGANE
jgi:hypothetical protein